VSKEFYKLSGKKVAVPGASGGWKFTPRPGGWWIAERKLADGSTERRRVMALESKGKLSAQLAGPAYFGELVAASRGGAAGAGSDSDLVAQFPGKVRKLLVEAGARVEAGQPLVLVEAMKMEFSVKAPANGIVKGVRVTEGQQLQPGDRFVDFEAEAEKRG
jgi:biotin carboxyl carrier protein